VSYRSEIAELAGFFRAYISLLGKFAITEPDEPFIESLKRKVLKPYLDQRFDVQKKYITVIRVNHNYSFRFDAYNTLFEVNKGVASYIDAMRGNFTLIILDPETIKHKDVLHLLFFTFDEIFNFLLNYDLLYSISSGNAKTKAFIQHIYNVMTGDIK